MIRSFGFVILHVWVVVTVGVVIRTVGAASRETVTSHQSTTTTTSSATTTTLSSPKIVDLSYLHTTPVPHIVAAIRDLVLGEGSHDDSGSSSSENNSQNEVSTSPVSYENQQVAVVVDLTASLVHKNSSDVLSELLHRIQETTTNDGDDIHVKEEEVNDLHQIESSVSSSSNMELDLILRQNHWTPDDVAGFLKSLLLSSKEDDEPVENGAKDQNSIQNQTKIGDLDGDNNITVASADDDTESTTISSNQATTTVDSNHNITTTTDNDDDDELPSKTQPISSQQSSSPMTPVTFVNDRKKIRPKIIVKSIDLGWNTLCIPTRVEEAHTDSSQSSLSSSSSSSSSKRILKIQRKALKDMNQQFQSLIEDQRHCPTTLRLDVCGIGPSTCRSIAKGIINRYNKSSQSQSQQSQTTTASRSTAISDKDNNNNNDNNNDNTDESIHDDDTAAVRHVYSPPPEELSLHLARNDGMSDPGVIALAAALRTVDAKRRRQQQQYQSFLGAGATDTVDKNHHRRLDAVLNHLDLSGCGITDVGAKALAIAIQRCNSKYGCIVRRLDLSNNHITNEGAIALAEALRAGNDDGDEDDHSTAKPGPSTNKNNKIEWLDLSHNKDIDDDGAKALAGAFGKGSIHNLIIRSCSIHADGAAAFGAAIRSLSSTFSRPSSSTTATNTSTTSTTGMGTQLALDLSGNPLGLLRKKPKGSNKYSAKELTNKATATTAAYMNLIGKTVQKGLKDLGLDDGPDTLESDDEEESKMDLGDDDDGSKMRCGALAFSDSFIGDDDIKHPTAADSETATQQQNTFQLHLGLRHCYFDTKAAEALAAVVLEAKDNLNAWIEIDVTMNHVIEDDVVDALKGTVRDDPTLSEMADNYLDAREALRESKERALQASKQAAARMRASAELDAALGSSSIAYSWDDSMQDEEWDSDADYDFSDGYEEEW